MADRWVGLSFNTINIKCFVFVVDNNERISDFGKQT